MSNAFPKRSDKPGFKRFGVICVVAIVISACTAKQSAPRFGDVAAPSAEAEQQIAALVQEQGINTALLGVIKNGQLVWQTAIGEVSPGVAANYDTRVNIASITKTVVAETALRLADDGAIDLDESMADYWVDPDLIGDPRAALLTPRHVLSHSTGLPNWRFFESDGKLKFRAEPGETHTYSGEGFEYLTRYIEAKLSRTLPELVDEYVFKPTGMTNSAISVDRTGLDDIAQPRDAEGNFYGYFCRPPWQGGACLEDGSYSAAGGMLTSVSDYASFLLSVQKSEGYGAALVAQRNAVLIPEVGDDAVIECSADQVAPCPTDQGYGLGFELVTYENETVIGHGGWDWSELALAYTYLGSQDGVIVFLNTPPERGLAAMVEILRLLDPLSPYLAQYESWLEQAGSAE